MGLRIHFETIQFLEHQPDNFPTIDYAISFENTTSLWLIFSNIDLNHQR
jgi:hypothetical protein